MAQIHPQTLAFLSNLKKNNNREWFEKNRKLYETIRESYIQVIDELIGKIAAFDPTVSHLEGRKCLFRINRDIRFSNDKSPYKTNMGAFISKGGKKSPAAGYYLHIQPGGNFIAGGWWMPEAANLASIRQEIDYNFPQFRKIVESASFKKTFKTLDTEDKLSRPPKNYTPGNPAIEYIKLKSFVSSLQLEQASITTPEFVKKLSASFRIMHPLIKFLNQAVER